MFLTHVEYKSEMILVQSTDYKLKFTNNVEKNEYKFED